jgi:hypothetical protein
MHPRTKRCPKCDGTLYYVENKKHKIAGYSHIYRFDNLMSLMKGALDESMCHYNETLLHSKKEGRRSDPS